MSCSCCSGRAVAPRHVLDSPYVDTDKKYITPAHVAAQTSTIPSSLGNSLKLLSTSHVLSWLGASDNNGRTPLMYAVHPPLGFRNGPATTPPSPDISFLNAILAHEDVSVRINHQDNAGNTALHWAAQDDLNSPDIVAALVLRGASVDSTNAAGETPFHLAVINGCLKNVKYLAEAGADVRAPHGALGWQPLHDAAYFGHKDIFTLLLSYGVDINSITLAKRTALSLAAQEGHLAIVQDALQQRNVEVNTKDIEGYTPLNWACLCGQATITQALLAAGADVQSRSATGQSTTYFACRTGIASLATLLLNAGAPADIPDAAGMTPLHSMAYHAGYGLLDLLLDHGADVNARAAHGQTLLHTAVRSPHAHHVQVLDILLRRGADARATDDAQRTPLTWAVARENGAFYRRLMEAGAGADVANVDEQGRTALHYACLTGDTGLIQDILGAMKKKQWEKTDRRGQNALHFAAAGGLLEVVELLLEKGVRPATDNNGWSPGKLAEMKGFTTVASRLEDGAWESSGSVGASSYSEPKSWDTSTAVAEFQTMDDGTLVLPGSIAVPEYEWHYYKWDPTGPARYWTVKADHCCPPSLAEYYFEVEITEAGSTPWQVIGIGWALGEDHTSRFDKPGGESADNERTIMYDSDDGRLHANEFELPSYGPSFGKGDTIGTGITADHSVYFTHNGAYLGTAVTNVRGQLYPLVSTNCPGLQLLTRFNASPPKDKPSAPHEPISFRTSVERQIDALLFTLYQASGLRYTNPRLSNNVIASLSAFSVGNVLPGSWELVALENNWTGWPPDALAQFRTELAIMVRLADPPSDTNIYKMHFLQTLKANPPAPPERAEDDLLNAKILEAVKRASIIYGKYRNVRGQSTTEQIREANAIRRQGGKLRWRDTSREVAEQRAKMLPLEKTRYEVSIAV